MSHPQSVISAKIIGYAFWLKFDASGGVSLTRKRPSLSANERAMALQAILPRSLFRTPELSATINVSEATGEEIIIDIAAAGDALSKAIGCEVELRVTPSSDAS